MSPPLHGVIKPSAVLIDERLNAKVSWRPILGTEPHWMASGQQPTRVAGLRGNSEVRPRIVRQRDSTSAFDFGLLLLQLFLPSKAFYLLDMALTLDPSKFSSIALEVKAADLPLQVATLILDLLDPDLFAKPPSFDDLLNTLQRIGNTAGGRGPIMRTNSMVARQNRIIDRLFPKLVAESLRAGRMPEPQQYDELSVMFADIVNYTHISSKLDARDVSRTLNELYAEFDKFLDGHDLFRLEVSVRPNTLVVQPVSVSYDSFEMKTDMPSLSSFFLIHADHR